MNVTTLYHIHISTLELVTSCNLLEQRIHLVVGRLVRWPEIRAHFFFPAKPVVFPAIQVKHWALLFISSTPKIGPISGDE